MNYYIKVLKHYADFTGRARRSEYWFFVLFNMLAAFLCILIDYLLGTTFKITLPNGAQTLPYGWIYFAYVLATLIPGLAVGVRRLHDVGKSGWMMLISFIPLVGAIWLLVLFFTDSQVGMNKWGPNPKGIGNVDEIDEIGNYLPG